MAKESVMKNFFVFALVVSLIGCSGKGLDGTYNSSWNGSSVTFSPNGTAFESRQDGGPVTIGGGPIPYSINGDVIRMGALQFKMLPDGRLDGGAAYGIMTKK